MTTPKQKANALEITRVVIFIVGALAIMLENPIGAILGIVSLAMWLWMPRLIAFELNLINKYCNNRA